jgi:MFS family permease
MMLDAVYAFIPLYVKERNSKTSDDDDSDTNAKLWAEGDNDISSTQVTLILVIFSVAQIVFAPFNAFIKNKMGSKNTMIIGFFLITVTTLGLGAIEHFDHSAQYLYSALALRFFQGQGDVLLQFVGYSIICNVFADDIMRHIAYVEIAVGLGLGIGPLVGGFLYGQF